VQRIESVFSETRAPNGFPLHSSAAINIQPPDRNRSPL
jgi:hypothetical protein